MKKLHRSIYSFLPKDIKEKIFEKIDRLYERFKLKPALVIEEYKNFFEEEYIKEAEPLGIMKSLIYKLSLSELSEEHNILKRFYNELDGRVKWLKGKILFYKLKASVQNLISFFKKKMDGKVEEIPTEINLLNDDKDLMMKIYTYVKLERLASQDEKIEKILNKRIKEIVSNKPLNELMDYIRDLLDKVDF